MGESVWRVPRDRFVELWNAAGSLDEVVGRVRELVGPPVPRWSVLARATAIRKEGVELKRFPGPGENAGPGGGR